MCKQLEEKLRLLDPLNLVREYAKLASCKDLSEIQRDRIGEILESAKSDGVLDRWIEEVDHFLGHKFCSLTTEGLIDIDNQAARLAECLGAELTDKLYLVVKEPV
jgi:hypothetical protein